MIRVLLLFVMCFICLGIQAQEFNLSVQVATPKLKQNDPKVFKTLENSIEDFFNDNKWTSHEYEDHEKIEGNFTLTILEETSATTFDAEIRLQSVRPVFSSNYKTPLINIVDRAVSFSYNEFQPVERSDNSFSDNLSSVLTFYVYMMLAYDYDSFSSLGGDQYFSKAQNVINVLPAGIGQGDKGWQSNGPDRNRYWMLENALNPRAKSFRINYYEYHRNSLDLMFSDADKAKAVMVSALTALRAVDKDFPNSMVIQTFADTKREEIVEIFKDANRGQQDKVYEIMTRLDPAQASLYGTIK